MFLQWTGHHDGMVTCCNFSQDGKYVVSGSDFDNALIVWDAFSGESIAHVESKSLSQDCYFFLEYRPAVYFSNHCIISDVSSLQMDAMKMKWALNNALLSVTSYMSALWICKLYHGTRCVTLRLPCQHHHQCDL